MLDTKALSEKPYKQQLCTRDKERHKMIRQSPDTAPQAEKVQIELIRESSVSRRVSRVRSLSRTTMYLSRRAVQRANPLLSERDVDLAFVTNHYGKNLAERLRLYMEQQKL